MHLAKQISTGKLVAIKIYDKWKLALQDRASAYLNEIEHKCNLKHDNVVRIIETLDCGREYWVVMELACKINLKQHLMLKEELVLPEVGRLELTVQKPNLYLGNFSRHSHTFTLKILCIKT